MSERVEETDSINVYLLAASTLLDEDIEMTVFNYLEELKNKKVNSLPIEAWSEGLLISTLASLTVIAKNVPEKRRSIKIIIKNIKKIMCGNYTE